MSRQTFSWFPDRDPEQTVKPVVSVTKFGDGYESRQANGMNYQPMSWAMIFTRDRAESLEILNFIRARGAVEAFNWINPLEETGVYVCREWKAKPMKGLLMQISCTFEQVFEA